MKVYISGPITGIADYVDRFALAEAELVGLGYNPVNPVTVGKELKEKIGREPEYEDYMTADLDALADCDCIYLMKGWEKSNGACREWKKAMELNIPVLLLEGNE